MFWDGSSVKNRYVSDELTASSALKLKAVYFSETFVTVRNKTWHYIPEDSNLDFYVN
jgi:hypothetical protein